MPLAFQEADFEVLAEAWNACHPKRYAVTPELLRANSVESPVFDWGASLIEYGINGKIAGFALVKRSAASLYPGPNPDDSHLSGIVYTDPKFGVDLLEHVKKVLRQRGSYRLVFGQDSRHFFPGCPSDHSTLKDFLTVEGFETGGEAHDVAMDLAEYEPPKGVAETMKKGLEVRPIEHAEASMLDQFLGREFSGRWRYDVAQSVEREGRADFVYGLFVDGELGGFAFTQCSNCKMPIGGAVFLSDLGDNWCSLGPIGVAKGLRGNGYGDALLAGALLQMKAAGRRRCVIDWTGLLDWYGKHGFQPFRSYRSAVLKLDES